jgi:aminomethyltransferase
MLGVHITGADRVKFAETVFPCCIEELAVGEGQLTSVTNEQGGLIDDCIVTNMGDYLYLVINAGHEEKDLPHFER